MPPRVTDQSPHEIRHLLLLLMQDEYIQAGMLGAKLTVLTPSP
jgi:hypothetical protein